MRRRSGVGDGDRETGQVAQAGDLGVHELGAAEAAEAADALAFDGDEHVPDTGRQAGHVDGGAEQVGDPGDRDLALGALGTTIFLFVNGLVGGLLTAAAPVLAFILRGRVGQEIKNEAKQQAPLAVDRVAALLERRCSRRCSLRR